jgi:hypothetical protein
VAIELVDIDNEKNEFSVVERDVDIQIERYVETDVTPNS